MSFLSTFTTDAIRIRVERSNFGVYDDDMHHVQLSEVEFFEMNPVITPTDAIAVKGGHYPGLPPANAIDGDRVHILFREDGQRNSLNRMVLRMGNSIPNLKLSFLRKVLSEKL